MRYIQAIYDQMHSLKELLLDQQLRTLEKEFLKQGGFTERLYRTRIQARDRSRNK